MLGFCCLTRGFSVCFEIWGSTRGFHTPFFSLVTSLLCISYPASSASELITPARRDGIEMAAALNWRLFAALKATLNSCSIKLRILKSIILSHFQLVWLVLAVIPRRKGSDTLTAMHLSREGAGNRWKTVQVSFLLWPLPMAGKFPGLVFRMFLLF